MWKQSCFRMKTGILGETSGAEELFGNHTRRISERETNRRERMSGIFYGAGVGPGRSRAFDSKGTACHEAVSGDCNPGIG